MRSSAWSAKKSWGTKLIKSSYERFLRESAWIAERAETVTRRIGSWEVAPGKPGVMQWIFPRGSVTDLDYEAEYVGVQFSFVDGEVGLYVKVATELIFGTDVEIDEHINSLQVEHRDNNARSNKANDAKLTHLCRTINSWLLR